MRSAYSSEFGLMLVVGPEPTSSLRAWVTDTVATSTLAAQTGDSTCKLSSGDCEYLCTDSSGRLETLGTQFKGRIPVW